MVDRKQPEPPLPLFAKILFWLELVQCCVIRLGFVGIISTQHQVIADSGLRNFLFWGMALNLGAFAFGGGGALATLAHRRYGPSLMGLAVALEVAVIVLGFVMNAVYMPPTQSAQQQITLMAGISFVYCLWLVVLSIAIYQAGCIFRFVDSPRTASQEDIGSFLSNVAPQELNLSENRNVKDPFCAVLSSQRQLTSLDLSSTWVTDAGVAALARLPKLARLDLSDTRVTDEVFQILSVSNALVELRLAGTECTTAAMAEFAKNLQASRPWCAKVEVTRESSPRRRGSNEDFRKLWAPIETPEGEAT